MHLPGALIAPPAGFVDPADDARTSLFSDTPRATGSGPAPDHAPQTNGSPTASPAGGSNAAVHTARNGSTLPKRSPGASGVNGAVSSANGMTAPEPAPAEEPAPEGRPNALSFFTAATATASTQSPAPAKRASAPSARLDVEPESAPIFERMTSEWLMDPTAPESRARAWISATDASWAAAANAAEQEPKRHTASGLPIRERGARLVPDDALPGSGARADVGKDPGAIRDILSRQLAGVRRGRAETDAADRRTEGDR